MVKYDEWNSLAAMFFERAGELGEKPFLWAKREGRYQPTSWAEAARQASRLSRGLRALGVEPGERVLLVSENRPEWPISDVAVMAAGAITVPAYTTNTVHDYRHLLDDSGASAAIVSTRALAARLLPAAHDAPGLRIVVAMETLDGAANTDTPVHAWNDVLAQGAEQPDDVEVQVAKARPGDLACLIYTSGTGGNPKGVMLSHRAILWNCKGAYRLLEEIGLDDETFLSFLPLSHSYEHSAGQFFPISIGAQIYYAEGADALTTNLIEARPTLMVSVPRLYEVMRQRIMAGVKRAGGTKAKMFAKAVELGSRDHEHGRLGLTGGLYNSLLDRLVRSKVRARFGGRLKAMVSGGAPLNPEVGLFFTALGVRILQGYGQTEAAPVVSCNPPRRVKLETVGPPCEGVEVRIAEDGEILVKGPLVMDGYWKNPEATADALIDGWLHTGDIGRIDSDGYIQITDRKKDIIVVSGGDNVSPQRVEGLLTLQPEIAQAMVYGDARPYLVALLVPDPAAIESFARHHKVTAQLSELAENAGFATLLGESVERANLDLSVIERVKRFAIARDVFSVENGQMTPTLKIRRHHILDVYRATIDGLYLH